MPSIRPLTITGFIVLVAVAFNLLSCSHDPADTQSTLDRIKQHGSIRIGYANEVPYAYKDPATGRLTGEAPEIARVLLREMGVTNIEGVLTEFGSLIPGLKAGRFDMIAAGMYITPERSRAILFSNPTYSVGEALLVQAGNPKQLHSLEEIARHTNATLGVVAGAIELGYARRVGIPETRIIVFPDNVSAMEGVSAGRVDAYAGTSLTIQSLLDKKANSGLARAEPFQDPIIDGATVRGYGAFGFRKGDADFQMAINDSLTRFIGTPEHLGLVRPFGFTEHELPGSATAEGLGTAP